MFKQSTEINVNLSGMDGLNLTFLKQTFDWNPEILSEIKKKNFVITFSDSVKLERKEYWKEL